MDKINNRKLLKEYYRGWCYWWYLKIKYHIDYSKVVLVLSGDNKKLDIQCVANLWRFAERKYVKDAIIVFSDDGLEGIDINVNSTKLNIEVLKIPQDKMDLLYQYYSFYKFFENIVFTYTDRPKGNLLGRFLRETEVNECDAACLALYHLRSLE